MKKLVSFVLVLALALSMSVGAFAVEPNSNSTERQKIMLKKIYQINGGIAPGETFSFDITSEGMSETEETVQPPAEIATVSFDSTDQTTEADIQITLPSYSRVGIYTYKITERSTATAGVSIYTKPVFLKVIVTQGERGLEVTHFFHDGTIDGAKLGDGTGITNTYDAGDLSVTKKVTGNLGDRQKEFEFRVTFTAPEEKTFKSTISYTDGLQEQKIEPEDWKDDGTATATISLKHDETVMFSNIPYGVVYEVVETDYTDDGYDVVYFAEDKENGGVVDSAEEKVTATNNKNDENIDTGITLDSMPYILVLVCVAAAGVGMIARKRRIDD